MRFISALFAFVFAATMFAQTSIPRPEHPRPQFVRDSWVNLNGTWSYVFDFGESGLTRGLQRSKGFENNITVPFCPESKLSGVEYKDFINSMWYHRAVEIPAAWDGKKILLNFGGVDYFKIAGNREDWEVIDFSVLDNVPVEEAKNILYNDWNFNENKFGTKVLSPENDKAFNNE